MDEFVDFIRDRVSQPYHPKKKKWAIVRHLQVLQRNFSYLPEPADRVKEPVPEIVKLLFIPRELYPAYVHKHDSYQARF
jgi:hypothetical protein